MKTCLFTLLLSCVCISGFSQTTTKVNATFMCMLKPTGKYKEDKNWSPTSEKIVADNQKYIDSLVKKGVVLFAGKTNVKNGDEKMLLTIFVMAADIAAAEKMISAAPAIDLGIFDMQVVPFKVFYPLK